MLWFKNKTYNRFLKIANEMAKNKTSQNLFIAKTRLGERKIICYNNKISSFKHIIFIYNDHDNIPLFSLVIFENGKVEILRKKHFIKQGQIFDAILELENILFDKKEEKENLTALMAMFRYY